MLDYLINNAVVFDGINEMPKNISVGIEKQKIAYLGEKLTNSAAKKNIDATGMYLCPGFIDTHASTGLGYTRPHAADHKIYQGVTTEIVGNCGSSQAPLTKLHLPEMKLLEKQIGFTLSWNNFEEWFSYLEQQKLPFNIGSYVGHNTLRAGITDENRQLTMQEISILKNRLDESCRQGILGFSTGLIYTPGCFANTDEIVTLAKIAAKYNLVYTSHIRNERDFLEDAINEAIEIGKMAKIRVYISHLKSAEKGNWGKLPKIIKLIEQANFKGGDVSFEVYPYTAVSTKLRSFIPKEIQGKSTNFMLEQLKNKLEQEKVIKWLESRETQYSEMIMITESTPQATGKNILALAQQHNLTGGQMIINILQNDPNAWIVYKCLSKEDVDEAVLHPKSVICSDSWSYPVNAQNSIGNPHPRTYGAFTRFLETYVIKTQRLSFGNAIKKITSFPANILNIKNRGCIAQNYFADLVLLKPEEIKEKATFTKPRSFSEGTKFLWINGTLLLENGIYQHYIKPGQIIKNGF